MADKATTPKQTEKPKKTSDACIMDPNVETVCLRGTKGCTVDHLEPVDPEIVAEIQAKYSNQPETGEDGKQYGSHEQEKSTAVHDKK